MRFLCKRNQFSSVSDVLKRFEIMETKEAALEGNIRTVGCSVSKLILNEDHLQSIRDVVLSTHKATILVSELLNIHIRRMLEEDPESDLQCCFNPNWLSQAYNGATKAKCHLLQK